MAHMTEQERCGWCNERPVAVTYRNGWDSGADFGVCTVCDAELATARGQTEPEWHDCIQCGLRYPEDAGVGPGACQACRNAAA
jgi:hypothetical protein